MGHDRARESDALLLPSAKVGHRPVFQTVELDEPDAVHHLILDLGFGQALAAVGERQGDVLENVEMRPHRIALKHHADVAAFGRHESSLLGAIHQFAADFDFAAVGPFQPRDAAQCRGFSAAARTKQDDEFVLDHLQVYFAHRLHQAAAGGVEFFQIADGYDYFLGHFQTLS